MHELFAKKNKLHAFYSVSSNSEVTVTKYIYLKYFTEVQTTVTSFISFFLETLYLFQYILEGDTVVLTPLDLSASCS